MVKNLSVLMSLAEVEQGGILPSCFSSHAVNKCPYHSLPSIATFSIFVLFVGGFTVETGHQTRH